MYHAHCLSLKLMFNFCENIHARPNDVFTVRNFVGERRWYVSYFIEQDYDNIVAKSYFKPSSEYVRQNACGKRLIWSLRLTV